MNGSEKIIAGLINFDETVKSPEKTVFAICQSIKSTTYEAENYRFRLFTGPSIFDHGSITIELTWNMLSQTRCMSTYYCFIVYRLTISL
jgi:hypothetical protein